MGSNEKDIVGSGGGGRSCCNGKKVGASIWGALKGQVLRFKTTHPAAHQPTPFHVNRFVLLGIYVYYAFSTASVYFGWRNMNDMLIRSRAYEWLCDKGPDGKPIKTSAADEKFLCNQQDTSVQILYTIAMACHFSFSAVSGFMIDTFGPRLTALIGQAFNFTAWMLLAFCSETHVLYIGAFVFMGAGADMGFLPSILLSNLFPGNVAVVITILGSACSASFAIPLILDSIWVDLPDIQFRSLCVGYAVSGPVVAALIALFLFPKKSFKAPELYTEDELEHQRTSSPLSSRKCSSALDFSSDLSKDGSPQLKHLQSRDQLIGVPGFGDTPNDSDNSNRSDEALLAFQVPKSKKRGISDGTRPDGIEMDTKTSCDRIAGNGSMRSMNSLLLENGELSADKADTDNPHEIVPDKKSNVRFEEDEKSDFVYSSDDNAGTIPVYDVDLGDSIGEDVEVIINGDDAATAANELSPTVANSPSVTSQTKEGVPFLKELLSEIYFHICFYFVIAGLALAYYQQAAGRMFSSSVEDVLKTLVPLSFIPCIVIGQAIDRFGIMPVIFFVNGCGALSYLAGIFTPDWLGYISILLFTIYLSVFTSQIYCFVENTFNPRNFGKFIGIASAVGGLMSLLSNLLYDQLTVEALNGKTWPVCVIFTVVLNLVNFLLWRLVYLRYQKKLQKAKQ